MPERCAYCGAPATTLRREHYEAQGGGIVCEANAVCESCAAAERVRDAKLELLGLLK
jgi:hypothetical protein